MSDPASKQLTLEDIYEFKGKIFQVVLNPKIYGLSRAMCKIMPVQLGKEQVQERPLIANPLI
jgi:hypothetical protein